MAAKAAHGRAAPHFDVPPHGALALQSNLAYMWMSAVCMWSKCVPLEQLGVQHSLSGWKNLEMSP